MWTFKNPKTWLWSSGMVALPVSKTPLSFYGRIYNLNFWLQFSPCVMQRLSDFSSIPQQPLRCGKEESMLVAWSHSCFIDWASRIFFEESSVANLKKVRKHCCWVFCLYYFIKMSEMVDLASSKFGSHSLNIMKEVW